jgi:trigger factor
VKSTVERLSPTRVRINVEVPFDELKADFDRAYKKIAQQVRVPGFRPGKVPARIIEARLGRGVVLEEVVNGAVPAKYSEVITSSEDLTPIGSPDIEVTEIADGDKLSFKAEVDVRPQIDLPDLGSLAVSVDDVEVTDADVQEQLDNLRGRFGTLAGVERPAAKDDFVLIDLSATVDGKPVEDATTTGFSYQVGQGGLIDGIDEAIEGLSAGEEATFTSRLVAGEFADKDAEVTVKVTAVKERQLPDADDEFAQLASEFDTLEELTADLRERLGRVKRMEQVTQARDKVLDAIVDATEVPLPESVVKAEIDSTVHDAVHPFDHDEGRFEEFLTSQGSTREEFDTETKEAAEKSVRTRLVLDALADREKTTVSEQELTERIVFQAQQYQMQPEEFVRRIQEAGQLGAVYSDVRRSKALIAAVRAASVTDASGSAVDMSDLLGEDEPEESSEDAVTADAEEKAGTPS